MWYLAGDRCVMQNPRKVAESDHQLVFSTFSVPGAGKSLKPLRWCLKANFDPESLEAHYQDSETMGQADYQGHWGRSFWD